MSKRLTGKALAKFEAERDVWHEVLDGVNEIKAGGGKRGFFPGVSVGAAMYELHTLGWHSFQQLCLTIVREVLGQTVESFLDSNDGGRDGAFAGQWSPTEKANEHLTGRFVIQCKFTSKSNYTLRLSDLSADSRQ